MRHPTGLRIARNVCVDLETAYVSYQQMTDAPELYGACLEWDCGRRQFHDQKAAGEVRPDGWQKDYFQGRDATGKEATTRHMTKVKPPEVRGLPAKVSGTSADGDSAVGSEVDSTLPTGSSSGTRQDQSLEWLYSQANVAIVMMGQEPNPDAEARDRPPCS
jgi:hypothetical protein